MSQQLTPADPPARGEGLITTADQYAGRLELWNREHYHVLCPAVRFSVLPASYGLMASVISINPDPDEKEVYYNGQFCKKNEVAIGKVGLRKISVGAGYSITTKRVDPERTDDYWEFEAKAEWLALNGVRQFRTKTADWNMRPGSARREGFKPGQVTEAKKYGLGHCESRAINAVIRELGIKQTYTKAELAKPFVVVQLMFQPDMSDPDVKRIVTEQNLRGRSGLYGGVVGALPPADDADTVTVEPVGTVTDADLDDLPMEEAPALEVEPDDLVHVTKVERVEGGGYAVHTRETGDRRFLTDDPQIAMAARTAAGGDPVDLDYGERAGTFYIIAIAPGPTASGTGQERLKL